HALSASPVDAGANEDGASDAAVAPRPDGSPDATAAARAPAPEAAAPPPPAAPEPALPEGAAAHPSLDVMVRANRAPRSASEVTLDQQILQAAPHRTAD